MLHFETIRTLPANRPVADDHLVIDLSQMKGFHANPHNSFRNNQNIRPNGSVQ